MNILTNWENFTDKELEQVKESLESEIKKRKTKIVIDAFLNAFRKLKTMGIDVSIYEGHEIPIYEEDFYFEIRKGRDN